MHCPRLYISAAHKSSGKTTISIGLCAALVEAGHDVRPFKKGPDYIDPIWLAYASGQPCYNLDFYTSEHDEILATLASHGVGGEISIIEGNKGLYDGLDLDGSNSNAALAKLTQTPIVLVIDSSGMTRGIAPLILGYQAFDTEINIAGVILNKLGGSRHEDKLRRIIEHYTDLPVLGAVHRDDDLHLPERHLGLQPGNEVDAVNEQIQRIGQRVGGQVDLDAILTLSQTAMDIAEPEPRPRPAEVVTRLRIGIARDAAFNFYYQDDLDAFAAAGAELVEFDTLHAHQLPAAIDGLFIGGGFPETQMQALSSNQALMQQIHDAIETGLPVYAECGGLMYLTRSLQWHGQSCQMVGTIAADTVMHKRPQGRGYVRMQRTKAFPWPTASQSDNIIQAHEFHYSGLENLEKTGEFGFKVLRGSGIDGQYDGIVYKNVFACYTHQRHTRRNPWVNQFLDFIRSSKAAAQDG